MWVILIAGEFSRILEQSWSNPKIVSQTVSHWLSESPNSLLLQQLELEARVGIEPTNAAFAEPCLTTWLPRRERADKLNFFCLPRKTNRCSIFESQLVSLFPKVFGLENSYRRDDAGDQFRRRHVKTRIACAARRIRHSNVSAPNRFRISDLGFRIWDLTRRAGSVNSRIFSFQICRTL